MRISYQGTVGWSSPTVMPEMANAYDYATFSIKLVPMLT